MIYERLHTKFNGSTTRRETRDAGPFVRDRFEWLLASGEMDAIFSIKRPDTAGRAESLTRSAVRVRTSAPLHQCP